MLTESNRCSTTCASWMQFTSSYLDSLFSFHQGLVQWPVPRLNYSPRSNLILLFNLPRCGLWNSLFTSCGAADKNAWKFAVTSSILLSWLYFFLPFTSTPTPIHNYMCIYCFPFVLHFVHIPSFLCRWRVQTVKLFSVQFSSFLYCFICLRSIYFPLNFVLKHLQSVFFPPVKISRFKEYNRPTTQETTGFC